MEDRSWISSNRNAVAQYKRSILDPYSVTNKRRLNTKAKTRAYITWTVLSVSNSDWLNSQCADRLISVVLIGQSPGSTSAILRPIQHHRTAHQRHHHSYKEPHIRSDNAPYTQCTHLRTLDAQYILPHNVHAQQSNIGNTRSPVTRTITQSEVI